MAFIECDKIQRQVLGKHWGGEKHRLRHVMCQSFSYLYEYTKSQCRSGYTLRFENRASRCKTAPTY